ncbi:MAG: hypothetical protein WAN20_02100 [Pseudonocardiaceae bacterium]
MLAIAAAVLFVIAQAQTAQAASEKATAARRKALAALAAKAQADDASEEALAELDWARAQNAAHLAAYQDAAELAHTELEEVHCAAAKAVTDAQKIAEAAIQKAIADRDRILSERAADMDQQIDRAKADTQAQVTILQSQLDAAKAEAEEPVKSMHGELAYAAAVTRAGTENANTERVARSDQEATVTQQRAQAGSRIPSARPSEHRKSKMTPALSIRPTDV